MTENAFKQTKASLPLLRSDIEKALEWLAKLDAQNIDIEIEDNKVTLRGKVRSVLEREEAEAAVWSSPGVSEVENRITVWH